MFTCTCSSYTQSNCDCVDEYKSLPKLELTSNVNKIPHLTGSDVDLHMPSDINFNYYSTNDFHNNQEIANCFSEKHFYFIHCNVRSISANLDNLTNMLNELHYPFTIVGLTETKLNISKVSIDNIDLPGYQFLSQPSLSNAGGAGIFVQDFVKVSIRPELTKSEPDFEALWIEVLNDAHSNQLWSYF